MRQFGDACAVRGRSALGRSRVRLAAAFIFIAAYSHTNSARADEGGVSFWVPGFFGSLAATPQQPGFSLALIYYHTSVSAGGDVAFARQVNRGHITANFNGNVNANIDAKVDLGLAAPTYVFAERFLGGQAAVSMLIPYGRNRASVDATLTGAVGPFGFTVSGSREDTVTGFGDLAPMFNVRCGRS
jgi:hypothetical protein